eukprot:scaffold117895_cov29-Tisochrysis_lutea.AAC.4
MTRKLSGGFGKSRSREAPSARSGARSTASPCWRDMGARRVAFTRRIASLCIRSHTPRGQKKRCVPLEAVTDETKTRHVSGIKS